MDVVSAGHGTVAVVKHRSGILPMIITSVWIFSGFGEAFPA
ncbi:MAG: hypothetical protein Q7T94_01210 [Rugosibacter sp.]|jgi:hypothetical protein|nr:hypothetical protein [Rugosibacter sp.]